ncbi:MAG: ATP-grasp domain-containing protein [Planctomycetota bacterium]|nr:ATP-grasp domain-containing protein [Planctomycetota bacterium]
MPTKLLCVGFSVRATAASASRAGFHPLAVDYFADTDLQAIAAVQQVAGYPTDVVRAAADLPAASFLYTGALENHPEIVQQLQRQRTLLGNDAATTRRVRDPFQLAGVLRAAGYPLPEITRDVDQVPTDGSWLSKNARGSGGSHVRPWYGGTHTFGDHGYFQKRAEGIPCSGVFLAAGGRAMLLGTTRQLIGAAWTSAAGFTYAGSIGPLALQPSDRTAWNQIGSAVASQFHLSGLFGVDAVLQNESLWPLEVNPRYTASVEVLERACGWHSIRLHVDACREARLPAALDDCPPNPLCCGKAILYARRDITIGPCFGQLADRKNREQAWPCVADIPRIDTAIRCGRPICTVLTDGVDLAAVEDRLKSLAAEVESAVYGNRQGVGSGVFSL